MERILIAVGSARRPKVEAVRDALALFWAEVLINAVTDIDFRIGVENRDYH
jgi:hypothetical protein